MGPCLKVNSTRSEAGRGTVCVCVCVGLGTGCGVRGVGCHGDMKHMPVYGRARPRPASVGFHPAFTFPFPFPFTTTMATGSAIGGIFQRLWALTTTITTRTPSLQFLFLKCANPVINCKHDLNLLWLELMLLTTGSW